MIMEKYYYLINGTVKVSDSKMPEKDESNWNYRDYRRTYNRVFDNWLSSLKPCEIDKSELYKIQEHEFNKFIKAKNEISIAGDGGFRYYTSQNPIEITDIVFEKDGKIYFKQPTEKQVESDAVEFAEWLNSNYLFDKDTKKWYPNKLYGFDETHLTSKQLYEIFKNR